MRPHCVWSTVQSVKRGWISPATKRNQEFLKSENMMPKATCSPSNWTQLEPGWRTAGHGSALLGFWGRVAAITTRLNGLPDAPLPGMTVQVDRARGEAIVTVSGRVTIDSSPQLRVVLLQLVQEQAGAVINIDLSKVPYMDTSGIATVLEALRSARGSVKLRMVGVSGQVRMLVEATQLAEVFQVSGSEVVFG